MSLSTTITDPDPAFPLTVEGPTKNQVREAVQRSHGVILRRAGIHPEFASHQARLNKLVHRAIAENEGDVDTMLIIRVGRYHYAFGWAAKTIRELKWRVKYVPTWLGGNYEVIGPEVIGEVLALLAVSGVAAVVVEIPAVCPEPLEAPPVPWETDPTPRPREPHPMDVLRTAGCDR